MANQQSWLEDGFLNVRRKGELGVLAGELLEDNVIGSVQENDDVEAQFGEDGQRKIGVQEGGIGLLDEVIGRIPGGVIDGDGVQLGDFIVQGRGGTLHLLASLLVLVIGKTAQQGETSKKEEG